MREYLYVFLAAALWASTPAVGKLVLADVDPYRVAAITSAIAMVILLVIALCTKKIAHLRSYTWDDYAYLSLMGVLGMFLYLLFLYGGLAYAPAQVAYLVNYLWPILIILFAPFLLREHLNPRKILAILLGFAGVGIIVYGGAELAWNPLFIKGILLSLAGAICFSLYSLLGKRRHYDPLLAILVADIVATCLLLVTSSVLSPHTPLSMHAWWGLIWLGVFPTTLSYLFWFLALRDGDTAVMSNLIFMTPFLSLVYIFFFLRESILPSSYIGLLCIVGGAVLQKRHAGPRT